MTGTLLDALLKPNPTLNTSFETSTGREGRTSSRKVEHYVKLRPSNIEVWEDFNFSTIISAYDHVLHTTIDEPMRSPTRSECNLFSKSSMGTIVSSWCKDRMNEGMKLAARRIQRDLHQTPIEPSLRVGEIEIERNPGSLLQMAEYPAAYFKPDSYVHGIVKLHGGPMYLPIVIKPSSAWRSSILFDETVGPKTALQPLRQLGTYCKSCNVRIGLIITSEEAVAVRYYEINTWEVGCQYMPVPWSNFGQQLTVNLTLWTCVMLSLNDRHHSIVPRSHLFPEIGTWLEEPGSGETVYHHIYSGHYTRSFPGSATVVKKGKGLQNLSGNGVSKRRVVDYTVGTNEDLWKHKHQIKGGNYLELAELRALYR
ncbi:hypothetical protein F5Y01DRAFT_113461 [Xylaria sp. FL0043]|nr:hypothetical protein F5Y01DRAFT_113461 [Xylaria sp. FL0043]